MSKIIVKIEIDEIDSWDLETLDLNEFKKEISDTLQDGLLRGCSYEIIECKIEQD